MCSTIVGGRMLPLFGGHQPFEISGGGGGGGYGGGGYYFFPNCLRDRLFFLFIIVFSMHSPEVDILYM